jgi:multidrug efflux pump subunit AcrA (membrane-fusion protein)
MPEIAFRILACVVILVLGVFVMRLLASQRKPPVEAEIREGAIHVDARSVVFEDVPVEIKGTGQVRARDVVAIAPEVTGRVVYIHPRLEMGEVIGEGEVLFRIDPRDYEARTAEAEASVNMWESSVERLEQQYAIDRERLKTLKRSSELAKTEYERVKRLFENDSVGTQSGVDQAERAWNTALDQTDQLSQQVTLYPTRIQEARSSRDSMQAMADLAGVNLERTEVIAPFNARIREVNIEAGQYLRPGVDVLTLADDSILEIPVGLNSDEARKWLQFGGPSGVAKSANTAWFNDLVSVPVEVRWIEGASDALWQGTLARVEMFDPTSRMLRVVVRVDGANAYSQEGNIPLVDGMFCRVLIPGKTAENVVRLPASAVAFPRPETDARTVYVARSTENKQHRLQTVPVYESHLGDQEVFIASGLNEGDFVVTTRLVNPLENALLEVEVEGTTELDS